METSAEIPNLKLAKVGDKRRRRDKGVGLIGFGGAGTAGSSGALATVSAKIGVAVLVAALGAGAYNVGVSLRPDERQFAAKSKPKAFTETAKPSYEGAVSNLPSTPKPSGDSLSMVSGSLGENPEQLAAQAAESAQDPQKKDPAETPAPDAAAAPAGMNPEDMMAAATKAAGGPGAEPEKDKKKTFSSRFGSLSSQLGGGKSSLAGGAGLAGGIGRGFEMPKFDNAAGRATGFRSSARAPALTARVGRASGRKGALGQLKKTSQISTNARHLSGEASAEQAKLAFDPRTGLQAPLSGVGAGTGRSPAEHPMDASVNPSGGGGPTEGQQYQGGGGGGGSKSSTPPGKDKTKWKKWVNIASYCLIAASALLLAATILAKVGWIQWPTVQILAGIAAVLAAIATLCGLAIIGMGQTIQGSLIAGLGAVTTVVSTIVAYSPDAWINLSLNTQYLIMGATGVVSGALGGMGLSGASHHWDA